MIVEDGTGKVDANSFITIAWADAYFVDRGITAWAALTDTAKEIALIKATDYIENRWGNRFLGRQEFPATPQALSFPRINVLYPSGIFVTGIPEFLKKATAEYAVRTISAELLPDPTSNASGFAISRFEEKIGPIEERTFYQTTGAAPVILRPYPAADRLLAFYVSAAGRNYR